MLIRFVLSAVLCCFFVVVHAQKNDYQWILGFDRLIAPVTEGYGLVNFDFTRPNRPKMTKLPKGEMYFYSTNSGISDTFGRLQCYSNGSRVFGPNYLLMENGDTLSPNYKKTGERSPQGALILPYPGKPATYLLLNKQVQDYPEFIGSSRLFGNIVDMKPNNGNGKMTVKRKNVLEDTLEYGLLTAVKHANGRDWWIPQPEISSNRFYLYYLGPQGLVLTGSQTVGVPVEEGSGQCVFTPDGTKYIRAKHTRLQEPGQVDIYDFDRCTGRISNQRTLVRDYVGFKFGIGLACSPDSRYLYVTQALYAYQYDLTATDIAATETVVGVHDGFVSADYPDFFELSQTAPDGRIYVGTVNTAYHISYIKHPTRAGTACGFVPHGINLTVTNQGAVPHFPNFRLGPLDGSPCDTLGLDNHPLANFRWEQEDSTELLRVTFTDLSAYEPESWEWDFGDGTGSAERYPVHVYPKEGVYDACLVVKNQYSADTFCQKVYLGVSAQDNPELQGRVEVWPNPFSDRLVLALSTPDLSRPVLRLFDAMGRLVQEIGLVYGLNEVETGDLPKGMYFWAVEALGQVGAPAQRVKGGKVVKM